jgi:glycerophosphoryl diester phosphodiesterase
VTRVLLHILLITIAFSCERVEYFSDNPAQLEATKVLAHKGGGGSFGEGNSFEACAYGLERLDGIEIDIQRDANNELWLSHSAELPACGSFDGKCFAGLSSITVTAIDSCLGPDVNFATLESIFEYVDKNYPEKVISLDVKAWSPCDVDGINVTREMNELAAKIIMLTSKYERYNKVMVESETGDFLYSIKKQCNFIGTYLTSFGDFELGASRALEAGFSGISYQFKYKEPIVKEQIDLIHRKGLKIQLWTIYSQSDLEEARALGPDFIQTDDL